MSESHPQRRLLYVGMHKCFDDQKSLCRERGSRIDAYLIIKEEKWMDCVPQMQKEIYIGKQYIIRKTIKCNTKRKQ